MKSKASVLIGFLAFFVFMELAGCDPNQNSNPQSPKDSTTTSAEPIYAWDVSSNVANGFWMINDSNNHPIHLLDFAKANGVNTLRMRLLNGSPQFPHPTIDQITQTATLAKTKGIQTWLDFHLSDVWADPGNQQIPASFSSQNADSLASNTAKFIAESIAHFQKINLTPEYIQIGNEVTNGFLWPTCNFWSTKNGFQNFKIVFESAANTIRKLSPKTKIILHLAGDVNIYYTIEEIKKLNLDFDIWGYSYYGLWHGCDASNLFNIFENTSYFTQKPFIIAEIAYPFTLTPLDNENNVIGKISQLCSGFSANANGQNQWLSATYSLLANKKHFNGIAYWEPAWFGKNNFQSGNTSPWENMCLFDFNGKPLAAAYGNWRKRK